MISISFCGNPCFTRHFPSQYFCSHELNITSCKTFAQTNSFFYSFVPHTISAWNALPGYVTNITTLSTFKNALIFTIYTLDLSFCFVRNQSGTTHYAIPVSLAVAYINFHRKKKYIDRYTYVYTHTYIYTGRRMYSCRPFEHVLLCLSSLLQLSFLFFRCFGNTAAPFSFPPTSKSLFSVPRRSCRIHH